MKRTTCDMRLNALMLYGNLSYFNPVDIGDPQARVLRELDVAHVLRRLAKQSARHAVHGDYVPAGYHGVHDPHVLEPAALRAVGYEHAGRVHQGKVRSDRAVQV